MPESDSKISSLSDNPEYSRRELVNETADFDGDNVPIHFLFKASNLRFTIANPTKTIEENV